MEGALVPGRLAGPAGFQYYPVYFDSLSPEGNRKRDLKGNTGSDRKVNDKLAGKLSAMGAPFHS